MLGPLTVFLFFVIGVITSWLCQLVLGMFPDVGSKFLLALGIQSFFDPIFILIVDAAQGVRKWTYPCLCELIG